MKRITASILTLVYLLATVGVAVNVHYCGGKIVDVQLYAAAQCCCGDEDEADSCCDEERLTFQLDVEQSVSPGLVNFAAQDMVFTMASDVRLDVASNDSDPDFKRSEAHPPPDPLPQWLLNCAPLHYG